MNSNAVIDAYVQEVLRHLPRKQRSDIGFELRGLLTEMLGERAAADGDASGEATVLDLLREFGTPAEVAAGYRTSDLVIIPADQSRSFIIVSLAGVGLQWALTLPGVFAGQSLATWWLSWGLGALWWPGFMVVTAAASTLWQRARPAVQVWRPRLVDPDRINKAGLVATLVWFAIGAAILISLPWSVALLPGPLPEVFALDQEFLRQRAAPVLLLWLANFGVLGAVLRVGRWSRLTRRINVALSLGWLTLLGWWLISGDIFRTNTTDDGAKAAVGLVMVAVILDLAFQLHRRTKIRMPELTG